jgi:alkanesulfonate monooxygenase SsuD/methylene tetrahydromethanopterin reductase-like flavin-dependent oxidoreductase (luciferase family)
MADSTTDRAPGGASAKQPRVRFGLALDFGTTRATIERLLDEYLPLIKLAEGYGFESVWLGQHLPAEPGRFHLPSPLIVLAAIAPHTKMTLGTGVILLPMCHPITLAYDAAVLDQLSGGRVVIGVGIGRPHDWARFGLDRAIIGDRMDEMLEALKALWSGADGYHGTVIAIDGGIDPLPTRPGGPPLWVGGTIGRAMRRAAVIGDGWYAGSTASLDATAHFSGRYRAALEAAGKDPATGRVAANRMTVLAESPEQAMKEGGPYLEAILQTYVAMGGLKSPRGEAISADMSLLPLFSDATCLVGSPETVIPTIEAYAAAGVTDLALRVSPSYMPPELVERTIRLAGEQVLPHFA